MQQKEQEHQNAHTNNSTNTHTGNAQKKTIKPATAEAPSNC